jgi:hypothetical protein
VLGPRRPRRCLIITTPTETAASARIASRIGRTGEEPPSSLEALVFAPAWVTGLVVWPFWSDPAAGALPEPLSGLPCPEPSVRLESTLPADGDSVTPEDPPSELPAPVEGFECCSGAEDPPPVLEELATVSCCDGGLPPVAVGGASEYWIPLESA